MKLNTIIFFASCFFGLIVSGCSSTTSSNTTFTETTESSQVEVSTDCNYGVCTTTHSAPNGDIDIYSTGHGQSYDVHARSEQSDETFKVRSWDSEGNSYSIESNCDSTGCHSFDSEGNRCSILSDGTIIGCN